MRREGVNFSVIGKRVVELAYDGDQKSYVHTWRAALLVEGYPVWSRGFTTKDATIDLTGRFKTLRKEFLRRATHEH